MYCIIIAGLELTGPDYLSKQGNPEKIPPFFFYSPSNYKLRMVEGEMEGQI